MPTSDGIATLRFYPDFPNEWEGFSPDTRQELGEFLERLQKGPLDPDLLAECTVHEPYYAFELPAMAVVYWKLEYRSGFWSVVSTVVEKIVVLAIETGN
ncbi:MAG TPA: hypothetical protein VJP02_05640 [Candidatus Sulfotelmatobacter sp.]|nr:hypothetical protein [Candidatus Sulfotelmatobacter sp.]